VISENKLIFLATTDSPKNQDVTAFFRFSNGVGISNMYADEDTE